MAGATFDAQIGAAQYYIWVCSHVNFSGKIFVVILKIVLNIFPIISALLIRFFKSLTLAMSALISLARLSQTALVFPVRE